MNKNISLAKKITKQYPTVNELCEWEILEEEGLLTPEKQAILVQLRKELQSSTGYKELCRSLPQFFEHINKILPYTERREVKQFFITGEIRPILRLVGDDVNRLEKPLLIEQREKIVDWWQDFLKIIKFWAKHNKVKYPLLRKLEEKIHSLIDLYRATLPNSRPGPKKKGDSHTINIVRDHLRESLAQFIKIGYPQLIVVEWTTKKQRIHKLNYQDEKFTEMLDTYLKQYTDGFLTASMIDRIKTNLKAIRSRDHIQSSITIFKIVEQTICERFGISQTRLKRKSKKLNLQT